MSDYLWDKTGEPDADVERLELLLGALRHEPRPLELPADAAPHGARRRGPFIAARHVRASRLFAPTGLVAAAALLLAFLIGAAVFMRPAVTDDGGLTAPRGTREPERPRAAEVQGDVSASDAPAGRASETVVSSGERKREIVAAKGGMPASRRALNVSAAHSSKGRQKLVPPAPDVGLAGGSAFAAMREGGAPSLVENTRLLAKEQLVYALRLTGAQLRDVRLRAQGLDEESSPKKRERNR